MSTKPPSIEEEAALYAGWDRGTFSTVEESVSYHHVKHGVGMSRWDYLRGAMAFDRTGADKTVRRDSVRYLHRNGEFLIESASGILSYGPPGS